jgi:hypothetical protein
MEHDGAPRLRGVKDLNEKLYQLREFSLFLDLDLAENIVASAEVGIANNLKNLTLNYAYLDFDISSMLKGWDSDKLGNLSVRLGKFLVPFLSYNENKPNFKQALMSQPYTAWNLAPVISSPADFDGLGWSDTGATLNWNRETGDVGILDLKLSLIKGLQSGSTVLDANTVEIDARVIPPGRSSFRPTVRPRDGLLQNEADEDFHDNNSDKALVAKATYRLSSRPIDFGLSWYKGAWDDDGDQDLEMWGAHFNWMERNWTLKAEYVVADVEQDARQNPVAEPGPADINSPTGDYNMKAWYVEGSFIPWRYGREKDRYIRLIGRYDDVDTNDEASFNPWDRSRFTVGTEWQFDPNARLRFEWQTSELDDYSKAPLPYKRSGGERNIQMYMFSLIFWF